MVKKWVKHHNDSKSVDDLPERRKYHILARRLFPIKDYSKKSDQKIYNSYFKLGDVGAKGSGGVRRGEGRYHKRTATCEQLSQLRKP